MLNLDDSIIRGCVCNIWINWKNVTSKDLNRSLFFYLIREFYRAYNERKRYLYDILEEKEMEGIVVIVSFVVVNVIWYVHSQKEYTEYVASCEAKL